MTPRKWMVYAIVTVEAKDAAEATARAEMLVGRLYHEGRIEVIDDVDGFYCPERWDERPLLDARRRDGRESTHTCWNVPGDPGQRRPPRHEDDEVNS